MTNIDVKMEAQRKGVKLWEIAEKLGISDSSFSRMLRKEFNEEKKKKCLTIIEEIKKERD